MVNHDVYIKPGDTLTVRVAPMNARSTTAPGNNNNNNNNNFARINLSAVGGKRNSTRKVGGKRPLSGYMKFCNKVRPEILKANPGMEFAKVGKQLGEKWRALSDAEKKKY